MKAYLIRAAASVFAIVCTAVGGPAGATLITVNTNIDPGLAGVCSLRSAIQAANTNMAVHGCPAGQGSPNVDTIQFAITPVDQTVKTIQPQSELPTITDRVVIDGYGNGGVIGSSPNTLASATNAVIKVMIDGTNTPSSGGMNPVYPVGLKFSSTAGGSTVKGIAMGGFSGGGIWLDGSSNNIITGNFLGTTTTGLAARPMSSQGYHGGVHILADSAGKVANNNRVGGTAPADRNLISAAGIGVKIEAYNGGSINTVEVYGNLLGPNKNGTANLTGTIGSFGAGVIVAGASNVTIGSTTGASANACTGGCNLFAGTYGGVTMYGQVPVTNLLVQSNFMGVNVTGTAAFPLPQGLNNNGSGVTISGIDTGPIQIGGTNPLQRNVIGGYVGPGVDIQNYNHVATIQVQGNFIGTDATGMAPIPNQVGVNVQNTTGVLIGGTAQNAGNVISGNNYTGVWLQGGTQTFVQGNKIGTGVDGATDVGNGRDGIQIQNTGFVPPDKNVIGAAAGSVLGGNVIAYNGADLTSPSAGVAVQSGQGNRISRNSFFSNTGSSTGLAIDLYDANGIGPSVNDLCDLDGNDSFTANHTTNYPSNVTYTTNGGITKVSGVMRGAANTTYTLEFYVNTAGDASGFGEGQTFIGSTSLTTGSPPNCSASFNVTTSLVQPGLFVTALAIDETPGPRQGDTSEFSGPFDLVFRNGFDAL
ncbi:beta strand repeat-containing protein [Tahibacter amnicola]|uniref:CSLREA domain-containing protein n=1 Tax=Tahibacter amnicola TaxID=2976241 RepID=A0ABY6BKA7_9GAMM|nr:hypothetical protein [Tahibacter amnicola]UXI70202.1 hypothetical protein N4264_11385 [Tahibacter amnicola]